MLRAILLRAAEGLVYTSESDEPFAFFELPDTARDDRALDPTHFAELVNAPPGARVETRTLDRFLARHIETSDPFDTRAQAIRPRYEHLKTVLAQQLRDVRAIRITPPGEVRIRCYIVGRDARGDVAGLSTIAVET